MALNRTCVALSWMGTLSLRAVSAVAALSVFLPGAAQAAPATWQTDATVGSNQVVYSLMLGCANTGLVCTLIDGYFDQSVSSVTGSGTFGFDDPLDEFQFDSDSSQDVGSGLQPAYATLSGSPVVFANIPFAGVPEIENLLVFALTNPIISAPGVDLSVPGDYPFSQTISYSGSGTVIGDLEFILGPNIIVPPDDIVVSGTLRVLGDIDDDGMTELELVGVTGNFALQNVTTISGETVVVDMTANMTMNLSGETAAPPQLVPGLGLLGQGVLVVSLILFSAFSLRRSTGLASLGAD